MKILNKVEDEFFFPYEVNETQQSLDVSLQLQVKPQKNKKAGGGKNQLKSCISELIDDMIKRQIMRKENKPTKERGIVN